MSYYYDDSFKIFAQNLEGLLANVVPLNERDLMVKQRMQLKKLIATEKTFRRALIANKHGPDTYRAFIHHILEERGNILAARPYFRERQTVFTEFISNGFKKASGPSIYKFKINWTFISWVLKSQPWIKTSAGTELMVLVDKIKACRQELLEENLPLAISQAKQFYAATPRSHLSFMDIVQIQGQGLLLAIDKFCPPDDKNMTEIESLEAYRSFRAVAIGIMRRDRVNDYSQTLMHFYPKDRQKIYWANKMLRRFVDEVDHDTIATEINTNLPAKEHTDSEEVADLLAAASTISADYAVDSDSDSVLDLAVSDDETARPDIKAEANQLQSVLFDSISKLSILESKLLQLKGIKV